MKEYKVMTVCPNIRQSQEKPVVNSIHDFFFAGGTAGGGRFDMQPVETLMRQMSEDGWEVISSVPTPNYRQTGELLITFERYV